MAMADEDIEELETEPSEEELENRRAIIESVHDAIQPVLTDLLDQFKNGAQEDHSATKAICDAVDRQIKDIMAALDSILLFTNLDVATGVTLDHIGDILCLSRAQASFIVGNAVYYEVQEDDEVYRKYLKYKALQNVSQGTYDDVLKAIQAVLDDSTQVDCYEDPEYPATIFVTITDTTDTDEDGNSTNSNSADKMYLETIPPIHPAGVLVYYRSQHDVSIELSFDRAAYAREVQYCGTLRCGTYPDLMYPNEEA